MSYDQSTMKIAGNYTVGDWTKLNLTSPEVWDAPDWKIAISIFETRIQKRFIEPIDELIKIDRERFDAFAEGRNEEGPTFGFAILALDCLLIETLQGVSEGLIKHTDESAELFVSFLESSNSLKRHFSRPGSAKQFYSNYRCALLHRGSTEGAFLVHGNDKHEIDGQKAGLYFDTRKVHAVNRTLFHAAVEETFRAHLKRLRGPPRSGNRKDLSAMKESRERLKTVMDAICGI